MENNSENNLPIYKRKEVWGGIAILGTVLTAFSDNTVAFQIGVTLNSIVAIGATFFGIKDGVAEGNIKLPSGMRKK